MDTNVYVAAFVSRGLCNELLEHCAEHHHIVVSEHILREVAEKMSGKFRLPPERVGSMVSLIRSRADLVDPTPSFQPACGDPDDDWILATAVAGECDCLVTGDKDLLVLERHEGIPIIAPSAFWTFEAAR